MPLIQSRACASRATTLSSISRLRVSRSGLIARPSAWLNRAVPRRSYAAQAQAASETHDSVRTPLSVEDIRLKNEFEAKRDIRNYLRKWQQITPNDLDPIRWTSDSKIRDVHELNVPGQPVGWVGNMLNQDMNEDSAGDSTGQIEDVDYFEELNGEGEGDHEYLHPGDLVTILFGDDTSRLCVYVRSVQKQAQFYTSKGTWRICHLKTIQSVTRNFATPEDVAPLHEWFPATRAELRSDMQSVPEGGVPREAGAHLLRMMDDFDSQVHELYRANSTRFDHLYDLVADEEKPRSMTLSELCCAVLEVEPDQMNDVIRHTVHRATLNFPLLIDSDQGSLFTDHYVIYPQPMATTVNSVMKWYREHQSAVVRGLTIKKNTDLRHHPMQKFLQKAQRLIQLSRKFRAPTMLANVGPSSQRFTPGQDDNPFVYREMPTEPFTDEDKEIIRLLQWAAIPSMKVADATLRSAVSYIMRATGLYSALDADQITVTLLLQELGVFTPWENVRLLDMDVALPGHGFAGDERWNQVLKACEELPLTDAMAGMRKDWGDLPVYCIDSSHTEELDDGVSLERIPGSEDTFWVRMHIANPSAFIPPDHPSVQFAADQLYTILTPEATYSMLPREFTGKHFSLAAGRPTITFSAKMNTKGEIFETDVRSGVVHNIIRMTPDTLQRFYGIETGKPPSPYQVGGPFPHGRPRAEIKSDLSPEDKNTFNTLRQLMLKVREMRVRNGALANQSSPPPKVVISVGDEPSKRTTLNIENGRYLLGDPMIKVFPHDHDPHEVSDMTKTDITSQLMSFGCWIAARWCADRNIPLIYDGTYYHPEYRPLTNKNMGEYHGSAFFELNPPRNIASSRPVHHTTIGFDAYTKATSPLRRFNDLLAQYQIEAALRFEHAHKRRFDAATDTDPSILPFSTDYIDKWISRNRWRAKRLHKINKGSKRFWTCQLLFRAFYFGECQLPETFECLVIRQSDTSSTTYTGFIPSLGINALIDTPADMEVGILDVIEAKITRVDPVRMTVMMHTTKFLRPFKRVGEWA
ncbi:hypothetical protein BDV18DRAFT_148015 [Aspergillus unguis]